MAAKEQKFDQSVVENDTKKVSVLRDPGVSVKSSDDVSSLARVLAKGKANQGNGQNSADSSKGKKEISKLATEKKYFLNPNYLYCKSVFEEALLKKQWKVVATLLAGNHSPNTLLSIGDSPLCIAVELGCKEMVDVLISGGANANSVNSRNESALYMACQEGYTEIVKILIQAGADINRVHQQSSHFTPLLAAVANDRQDIVQVLVRQNNIDVNAQDVDGCTSLWHAYSNCSKEICTLLLKAGAKIDLPNNEGHTVFQEAEENEDGDFLILFRKYNVRSR